MMSKKEKKSNYGLGILLGFVSFVLSLAGTAMGTFGGNEAIATAALLISYALVIATYIVCGGFRKTIRYCNVDGVCC